MFRGLLTLDLHATHLGTGMLRMHRWLADQRRVIGNSAAPCLLDEAKRVCVVSGELREGGRAWRSLHAPTHSNLPMHPVMHPCVCPPAPTANRSRDLLPLRPLVLGSQAVVRKGWRSRGWLVS